MKRRRAAKQRPGSGEAPARPLRVAGQIRRAVADIFQRGDFHRPLPTPHPVTVTEVQISPDLRKATIYILPLGGAVSDTLKADIDRRQSYFRREIGRRCQLRHVPEIAFAWDGMFDRAARIDRLLQEARQRVPAGPEPGPADATRSPEQAPGPEDGPDHRPEERPEEGPEERNG